MSLAAALDKAIRAVCPIDGISIGRADDKATWRIDFREEASPEQRDAAQAVVDGYDVAAVVPPVPYAELRARLTDAEKQAILGSTDWRVRDFLGLAQAEREVNVKGTLAQQAKALLVGLGLLTQDRADAVFS